MFLDFALSAGSNLQKVNLLLKIRLLKAGNFPAFFFSIHWPLNVIVSKSFEMKTLTIRLSSQYQEDELLSFIGKYEGSVKIVNEDDFLSFVHDIRNPLSALKLQTRLLRKFKDDETKSGLMDQKLEKMEIICDRIDNIIEEFLTQRNQSSYKT